VYDKIGLMYRFKMRHLYILIVFIVSFVGLKAQNMPVHQQYSFDNMLLNPAFTGIGEGTSVKLIHRQQWLGFTGAPHTSTFIINGRTGSQPVGLGAFIYSDINGPNKTIGVQASFAYHLLLASKRYDRTILSFALSFHGIYHTLDQTGFSQDFYDPIITYTQRSVFLPDFNAGMVFTMKGIMAGISADHLIPFYNKLYDINVESIIPTYMNFHAGYVLDMPRNVKIKPLINVRTDYKAHSQLEIGGKFSYAYGKQIKSRFLRNPNEFWIGLNYRQTLDYLNSAPLCIQPAFGFKIGSFSFAYQFDLGLTTIQRYSYGTHQVMIGLKFISNKVVDIGRSGVPIFNEEF